MFDEFDKLLKAQNPFDEWKKRPLELIEGERRVVTILFADIKGFTSLSEKMDSEHVKMIMDKLLTVFTNCIKYRGGMIDKYEGDLVMALFGAKKANENDTENAVHSALEMLEKLGEFNKVLKNLPQFKNAEVELAVRIGINTGLVTTGKVGEKREGDFTVYGDAVNIASRLESNAPVNNILVSAETQKLVAETFNFDDLGEIKVKGKAKPIKVFTVKKAKNLEQPKWILTKKSKLLGRKKELLWLQKVCKESSNFQLIGVKGEAGIGKTRFVFESLNSFDKNFILKNESQNVTQIPYSLFIGLIKNYFGIRFGDSLNEVEVKIDKTLSKITKSLTDSDLLDKLTKATPILKYLVGIKIDDSRLKAFGRELQLVIQVSIRDLILVIASIARTQNSPLVIVLDAIQWIEDSSLEILKFLKTLNQNKELKIFIFLLYREDFRVPYFLTESHFQEITLAPLDEKSSLNLIHSLLGEFEKEENIFEILLKKSLGNPFYIEEWVKLVKEKNLVKAKGNKVLLKKSKIPIPINLNSLILSRIDSLDEELKLLLQKASVIGKVFILKVLSELENKFGSENKVSDKIENLVQNDFLKQILNDIDSYSFKNILTHEVAYNHLLLTNRKILHKSIGEIIESTFKDNLEEFYYDLARHFEIGEVNEKAIDYLLKSSKLASLNFENQLALDFLNRILKLVKSSDLELKTNVLMQKGQILNLVGEWSEAEEIFEEVIRLAKNKDLKEQEVKANRMLGWINYSREDLELALSDYEKALEIAQRNNFSGSIAGSLGNIGQIYLKLGKFGKAKSNFEEALSIYEKIENSFGISAVYGNLGSVSLALGKTEKAIEFYEKQLALTQKLEDKVSESTSVGNLGLCYTQKNDFEKALEFFEKQKQISEEIGYYRGIRAGSTNIGSIYKVQKNFAKATECFEEQIKLYQSLGDKFGEATILHLLAETFFAKSDFSQAEKTVKKGLEICETVKADRLKSTLVELQGKIQTKLNLE